MGRYFKTLKMAGCAVALSLTPLANGHDYAPSPHPHAAQSYEGTHSVNSNPVSGRQMRMYRAGAAMVPDSEQHVLGLINVYNGDGGSRPTVNEPYRSIAEGSMEGIGKESVGQSGATLAKTDKDMIEPTEDNEERAEQAQDPVYEAFRKWCDLQLQPSMTQEEWEIVRTNTMPEGMSCEMK